MDLPQINKLDPEFTFWLLRRVDPAKRVIWIDDMTPVPIRDVDYQRVLGLPCGKRLVSGLGSKDPEDKIDFINLCIGTGGVKELYCSLKDAEFNVEKQHQGPMDKGQCDNFKVSFVVWLVCRWLAPIRRPNNGSETFWGALLKPDKISCYNWCAFALEALFDAVRKFQNDITSKRKIENLALCPIFLQIFFIDYVKNGGVNQPGKFPRIADYDYQSISFMIQELNEKMQREADLKKKQIGNKTYSLDSFQKAVGASKGAMKTNNRMYVINSGAFICKQHKSTKRFIDEFLGTYVFNIWLALSTLCVDNILAQNLSKKNGFAHFLLHS